MYTLQIEHKITDFAVWKAAFDRDPVNRAASGVTAHRISRPVDDPHYVVVELDFEQRAQADALLAKLQTKVWKLLRSGTGPQGWPEIPDPGVGSLTPAAATAPSYATASASRTVSATAAAPAAPMTIV